MKKDLLPCPSSMSKLLSCLLVLFVASACTIRPLYTKKPPNGQDLSTTFQQIRVSNPKDRLEQIARNEIIFQLYGGKTIKDPAIPRYLLDIAVTSSTEDLILVRELRVPAGKLVNVYINYTLKDLKTNQTINSGKIYSVASYEWRKQRFSNQQVEISARDRVIKNAAEKLIQRISGHLASVN